MNNNPWPCVDPACGTNLGNISNGELVIALDGVKLINTQGINLVLTCVKCGKPKVWFSKPSAIKVAFVDLVMDYMARQMERGR